MKERQEHRALDTNSFYRPRKDEKKKPVALFKTLEIMKQRSEAVQNCTQNL